MTFEELKKYYKNGNRFEIETGLSHVNWLHWKRRGYIPINSQMKIERITQGKLTADLNHVLED
jgi:hypothetical protein